MTNLPPSMIIAGGAARRMDGSDKALMALGQARVIDHLLAALRPQAGPLAINANGDQARWSEFGLAVRADPVPDRPGPLAGILAAMLWAGEIGAERVITVAGDTPFLPQDFVARLDRAGPCAIAETRAADGTRRAHPVCGLWPVSAAPALRAQLDRGERRVMRFVEQVAAQPVLFDEGKIPAFFNINTPEDLDEANRLLNAP